MNRTLKKLGKWVTRCETVQPLNSLTLRWPFGLKGVMNCGWEKSGNGGNEAEMTMTGGQLLLPLAVHCCGSSDWHDRVRCSQSLKKIPKKSCIALLGTEMMLVLHGLVKCLPAVD